MDLFMLTEEGPGFPFFLPKGMVIRNGLETFWRQEHVKRGYEEIKTPLILNEQLWRTSGHWDHYKDNMYFTKIDDEDYAIKPMNCPGSMLVYKTKDVVIQGASRTTAASWVRFTDTSFRELFTD